MAGYNWNAGKSNNAVSAEGIGLTTASSLAKKLKVDTQSVRENLDRVEWHHTGKYFNSTDYFDGRVYIALVQGEQALDELRFELRCMSDEYLGDDAIEDERWNEMVSNCRSILQKMRCESNQRRQEKKKETGVRLIVNCRIRDFVCVRGRWRLDDEREYENVEALEKGAFLELDLPEGRIRKKKDGNAFDYEIVKVLS